MFSATRKCGHHEDLTRWAQLGLTGGLRDQPIQLYGRNSVSGTYGYFKKQALCKGDFKNNVNEQPGSASVVQSVTKSLNGIGYSGIGYKTSGVRAVPLARKAAAEGGANFIEATPAKAIAGDYPLARFLYGYVNKAPNRPLPPMEREFVKMIMSKVGQEVVVKDGYIPLPAKVAARQLAVAAD